MENVEHVRTMCKQLHGHEKEQDLYARYGSDIDEYIEISLQQQQTSGLLCRACTSKHCTIQLLQTRAADEGMTAYIVCPDCGARRLFS